MEKRRIVEISNESNNRLNWKTSSGFTGEIESGQILSEGIVNPADVTRLRGIGEGRKKIFDSLRSAYLNDGKKINKVHMETLSRAMVNHVKIDKSDDFLDNIPGDIVTFEHAQKNLNIPKI